LLQKCISGITFISCSSLLLVLLASFDI